MANPLLVELLRQGSKVWNDWREQQTEGQQFNLFGVRLSGANLNDVFLRGADLRGADLRNANLSDALQPHFLTSAIWRYCGASNYLERQSPHGSQPLAPHCASKSWVVSEKNLG
jgi:hypothetical protein